MTVTRQSATYFIIQVKDLGLNLLVLFPIYQLLNSWLNNPFFVQMILGLVALICVARLIIGYFNTTYSVVEPNIFVHDGILDVRTINITDNTGIVNYRIMNTWIHKIVGVKGLIINFKNGEDQAPIKFQALSTEQLELLTKHIKVSDVEVETLELSDDVKIPEVDVVWHKIVITGLLSANYILLLPILVELMKYFTEFSQYLPVSLPTELPEIIIVLVMMLLFPLFTIGLQFMRYAQFEIYDQSDRFVIENGIIDSDAHVIQKQNINGLVVEQTLGMRALGLCSVSVVINDIDTDDGLQTKNTLFPYVKVTELNNLLMKYLPTYADKFKPLCLKMTLTKMLYMMLVIAMGLGVALQFSAPVWSYIVLLAIVSMLSSAVVTTMKQETYHILIREGLLNTKTYILPNEKIGVSQHSRVLSVFKFNHVYTDLKPSHHFKELH